MKLALVALVGLALAACKPVTYKDLADDDAKACISHRGFGDWRASSGLTLDAYCKAYAAQRMVEKFCKDNPDRC